MTTRLDRQSDCCLFLQGNHDSGSHPNEDIKVFKKHRVSDYLYTIILFMVIAKEVTSSVIAI